MKKMISLLLCGLLVLSLTACGGNAGQKNSNNDAVDTLDTSSEGEADRESDTPVNGTQNVDPAESSGTSEGQAAESIDAGTPAGSNILVAYFSLADEQYEVGVIEKGNTQIIAEMIAEQTGADTFSIERAVAYPTTYDGLLEISREEESNPPEIAETVENMDDYTVIFIGYPNWWTTMPMALFTFLESYDFSGKTICPLITHGGSGFSNSLKDIARLCPGAVIKEGLAIHGDDAGKSDKVLDKWVKKLGISL